MLSAPVTPTASLARRLDVDLPTEPGPASPGPADHPPEPPLRGRHAAAAATGTATSAADVGLAPRSTVPVASTPPAPDMRSPAALLPAEGSPGPSLVASGLKAAGRALRHGAEGARDAIVSAGRNLWSLSDLRTMLQPHGNDPDFLRILRGQDEELGSEFTFAQCRAQLARLRQVVEDETAIEPRFRKALLEDVKAIEQAVQPLEHGTSAAGRAVKAVANLVNLWPVVVPSPLMANQAKTFAYTVAAAVKAVVGVAGATLRSTADGLPFPLGGGELGRHADEVHFYPALLNAIFLSVEMSKKYGSEAVRHQGEAFDRNKLAHAGIAAACGMALIAPFVWSSIKNAAHRTFDLGARAAAAGLGAAGYAERADAMRRQLTPGTVGEAVHAELAHLWNELESGRLALQRARHDFTDPASGTELTRTLNSQCTHLLEVIARCTGRLDQAFHLDAAAAAAGDAAVPRPLSSNRDFAPKLALTIFAAAVTGTTVYLIQPDPIGTVDLSADGVVVTAVMAQSAWNAQATRQDAMERFKGMAATSMVMAIALTVDKLSKLATPKGLVEASSSAPYYASLVMTAMAMTMPGPVARGAELAMNWGGSRIARLFKGPDGQALATTVPSSPQELQQRVTELHEYLQGLDPQQQLEYAQVAGASLLQAMDDSSRRWTADERASTSGVSIEEIEEMQEPAPGSAAASPR